MLYDQITCVKFHTGIGSDTRCVFVCYFGCMEPKLRENILGIMKERGISQNQLAKDTGMARTNLSRVFSGKTANMPLPWSRILDHLGLELVVRVKAEPDKPKEETHQREG